MGTITVKQLTVLNHKKELIKESTVFLSHRISQFNDTVNAYGLSPDNPIVLSSDELSDAYKVLARNIGELSKSIKGLEGEILVDNEN